MAFRNLTDVFVLMRNNALQNRHILSEQFTDDQAALVGHTDIEKGYVPNKENGHPPSWMDGLEEMQYVTTKIKQKMKVLSALHEKHLHRPTFDESSEEERSIEILTQEITQMFTHCQRIVHKIRSSSQNDIGSRGEGVQESRVAKNVVISLATSLQELSTAFRVDQSAYLRRMKSREERSQQFLDAPLITPTDENDLYIENLTDQAFTDQQLLLLEENTERVREREREVNHIVRSILDLNEIFRDLANIIHEQGTVLDRIDYNVELVQSQVKMGLEQLRKAEGHQRSNRKMTCIMVMAITTVLLIILLVVFKT